MSKPVKTLLRKNLVRRLAGVDSLAVLSLTGVDGISNNRLRRELRAKDIRVAVVKNSVARAALADVGLSSVCELIDGPCALAFGGDNVVSLVRELLDHRQQAPTLTVKGALLEGEVFASDRVEELSRYPTRDEAVAQVAGLALSPGGRLAAALRGPGGRIAGGVKSLEERTDQG